ncbi:BTB/POZ and MATH domain-containing protein 5 [Sorghum bicolor]|uniref:BTB/POZ and MATH domain-containing protein 5 n=1 Tax=Sorghum bicolor TaxID=4558 RepID=UPI000B42428B|nr:BTB/POZ and MATH domain-containing protein 5 [Sorghum bicolor]|eukprot:XP_021321829.1 BTB/POZ and MATH domain-containing protein 5 [Sorghum bicolor]
MTCGAGDGGVVVSASSITTVASTGSHMLKINGYSAAKQLLITGSHAKSCEFEAAGHTWCIFYYPNGTERKAADYISFFLRLARNVDGVVNARVRRKELEKSSEYLVDDCFAVRCDIDVLQTSAESSDVTVEVELRRTTCSGSACCHN